MQPDAQLISVAGDNHVHSDESSLGVRAKLTGRRVAISGLYYSGLLRIADRLAGSHNLNRRAGDTVPRLRRSNGSKFGILCYHRVGTGGIPLFSQLAPRTFEAQMRHIRKHFRVVPLGQLCREMHEGLPVKPTLAVTFDDGYRDLYTHAFPVLREYQIPATIYLIGECMETGEVPWYDRIFLALKVAVGSTLEQELDSPRRFNLVSPSARAAAAWEIVSYLKTVSNLQRLNWCDAFERRIPLPQQDLQGRMLDWQQVREMSRGGIFFGAHTMSHPVLSRLEGPTVEVELLSSKRLLEQGLGRSVEEFAYPFGKPEDWGVHSQDLLKRCGYRSAVTTSYGLNTTGMSVFRLRRYQIGDENSLPGFAFNLSRMFLEGAEGEPASSTIDTSSCVGHSGAGTELHAQVERIGT